MILDGRQLADKMQAQLQEKITKLPYTVCLAVVMVEGNAASKIYVQNKVKACNKVGIECRLFTFKENVAEEEVANCLQTLAQNKDVHGILLQMPLPKSFDTERLLKLIPDEKDVDGFSANNVGKLCLQGKDCGAFVACTPLAVIQILKANQIEICGQHVVVVGRSNIVGKPLAMLFLAEGATVSICHSQTKNLKEMTRQADILVVAVGKENLIDGDMVKEGVVVVDVGINRRVDGSICGDVDFAAVQKKVFAITPVPGGVGPMTITMLLYNSYQAACNLNKR